MKCHFSTLADNMLSDLATAYGGRSQFDYTDLAKAIVGQANNGRLACISDASPIFEAIETAEYEYYEDFHITLEELRDLVRTALEDSPFSGETKADISSRLNLSGATQ